MSLWTAWKKEPITIKAGAADEVGNTGESALLTFAIDKTPPEILNTLFRDTGDLNRIIEEQDYISGNEIWVNVYAEDLYRQEDKTYPGKIKAFYWDSAAMPDAVPVFNTQRRDTNNEFVIKNLGEGVNYIFIAAEDEAGNLGVPVMRRVLRDSYVPGPPIIRSATHKAAVRPEQAGPLPKTDFQFSPSYTMKSGIAGYQWKLEKILIENGYAGDPVLVREGISTELDQEGKGFLSLEPGDNGVNEFYRLTVFCIGGNRKAGGEGTYQFRIDSTPPGELRISAVPQADSGSWHNSGTALISWNKPADMTGIAEYRYTITADENWKIPNEEELKSFDLSHWNTTKDTECQVNLRSFLGVTGYGTTTIAVCAIDYSGNRKLGTAAVKNDFIPPVFNNSSLIISSQDDHMGKGKLITWGAVKDDESGLDRIVLIIGDGEKLRSYTLIPGSENYLVSPLDDDRVFTVTVRAYDNGGNINELYGIFATGNAVAPASYKVPYLESIGGYELSGNRIIGAGPVSYEDLKLRIPGSMSLFAIQLDGGHESRTPVQELALEGVIVENGIITQARSPAGRYEISAGGFTLEGSAVLFDRNTGLDIEGAKYTRSVLSSGVRQDRIIEMGTLSAGFPPLPRFISQNAAIGGTVDIETYTPEGPGFKLESAEYLGLRNGREWFSGKDLSFDLSLMEQRGIYLEDPRENRKPQDPGEPAGARQQQPRRRAGYRSGSSLRADP